MAKHALGLLDTSALVDLERLSRDELPDQIAVSAISLAELAAGPHGTSDLKERAIRQERLQRIESSFDTLPFDERAARAFGSLYAIMAASGRKTRASKSVDLLIAATAQATSLPLYTRNPDDFSGLGDSIEVVAI